MTASYLTGPNIHDLSNKILPVALIGPAEISYVSFLIDPSSGYSDHLIVISLF